METAIIIVLAFMLLISIIILIDIRFDIKGLNIKNQACASALDKSKKENQILKNKNAAFKNQIHQQHTIYCKENDALKLIIKFRDSKIKELENKYQSSINKINERDEKIRDRDSQIIELEKTKNEYSQRVFQLHGEKRFAINQSECAIKLSNKMAQKFKAINLELEVIESQLLEKLNP